VRVITLEGSPLEMGRAFGESLRAEIATFYELRVQNAIAQALRYGGRAVTREDVTEAARQSVPYTRDHDPRGFEELEGIAQGAALPLEAILAMNGLTDLRDVLSWHGPPEGLDGCSALVVQRDLTARGELLCGQTWDLATDNLPYVLGVHRKPDQGPQSWSLTTAGCLSLIGLNEAGIAVGTTNIRTTDARPGVTYLSLIHKALAATTLAQAAAAITDAHRAAAHFYYLADAHGDALVIECSATRAWTTSPSRAAPTSTPTTASCPRTSRSRGTPRRPRRWRARTASPRWPTTPPAASTTSAR
jgi:isopenicillin-N N-acyltransferase-like protein